MATSGSTDFSLNRDQLIQRSLRLCNVMEANETPTADQINDASEVLNGMVKGWMSDGLHLHRRTEGTLFLETGTAKYNLASNRFAKTDDVAITTTSAAASSAASAVVVTSATGIVAADVIGVELDDGTIDWDTVASVASTTVNLTGTLSGDVDSGAAVYVYTTAVATKPMSVLSIRREENAIETQLIQVSAEEYFNQPNKTSQGRPTMYYYDRQLDDGDLYLWPTPDTVDVVCRITYLRPFEDFDAQANTPDFPIEWIEPLAYGLAARIAPEYGSNMQRIQYLEQKAAVLLKQARGWDRDVGPIYMQPSMNGY